MVIWAFRTADLAVFSGRPRGRWSRHRFLGRRFFGRSAGGFRVILALRTVRFGRFGGPSAGTSGTGVFSPVRPDMVIWAFRTADLAVFSGRPRGRWSRHRFLGRRFFGRSAGGFRVILALRTVRFGRFGGPSAGTSGTGVFSPLRPDMVILAFRTADLAVFSARPRGRWRRHRFLGRRFFGRSAGGFRVILALRTVRFGRFGGPSAGTSGTGVFSPLRPDMVILAFRTADLAVFSARPRGRDGRHRLFGRSFLGRSAGLFRAFLASRTVRFGRFGGPSPGTSGSVGAGRFCAFRPFPRGPARFPTPSAPTNLLGPLHVLAAAADSPGLTWDLVACEGRPATFKEQEYSGPSLAPGAGTLTKHVRART